MRHLPLAITLLLLVLAAPAGADPVTVGAEVVARDAAATCRSAGGPCQPQADVSGWQDTWTHRALAFQYALGNGVALRDAPWVGTHNSFNSIAEMGTTVSDTDANQQLSLTDQLRVDVRSLEPDLHWWPSLSAGGARAPVVCHAQGGHEGCSIEKPLGPVLDAIGEWLRAHPRQVLLLYAEDHLDGAEGYDAAAGPIGDRLGPLLYRPAPPASGSACAKLPLTLSRDAVLAAGAQVVIVS